MSEWASTRHPAHSHRFVLPVALAAVIVAIVLMFLPESNRYFRRTM